MSWDAYLTDDRGHQEGDWNFTHNTSVMIYDALLPASPRPWWKHLDGMPGPTGAAYLDTILRGLTADPDRYRAMNPANGWGDYDSLVAVLTSMRDAVPEWPTVWGAFG